MERLRGKWVVLIGNEDALLDRDEGWVEAQAQALAAARPAGLVVTANRGNMTMAFIRAFANANTRREIPVVAVAFLRSGLTPTAARYVSGWVEYAGGPAGGALNVQTVLDGHAVAVARMRGIPGILALTRTDDRRERLCRQMALDWNIMVVVRKSPDLPVVEAP